MASSGVILPNPKWYFVDNNGEPLGAGFLYTYRSLDKTQKKFVYQDPGLTLPYADPIRIDENGTAGPLFWTDDEAYYLVVTDMFGNMIWDMDGYGPGIAGGGGGGPPVNTAIDLENLVQNNIFYRNIGASTSPAPAFLTLAPGAHSGFAGNTALAATTGSPAPDIIFAKNNTAATDQLQFLPFSLGSTDLSGDVTPPFYLNYSCSNNPVGETFKYVQFPICSNAQSLSSQTTVGKIWARWNSGTPTLQLYWRQFYGDGPSASAEQRVAITTINLITDGLWHHYQVTAPVPNASGKVRGECGNDGLFLQVEYPLGTACNIDFVKPSMFLGSLQPAEDFHSNDQIEGIVNDFRTGDIRTSLNAFAPYGWVPMNDGTIGSAASLATTRANRDTFPLYKLIWESVSNTYAPVSTGRGATAVADFVANKTITLTRALGRVLGTAGAGSGLTPRALGEFLGTETHTLTQAEMPAHVHNSAHNGGQFYGTGTGSHNIGAGGFSTSVASSTTSTGGGAAHTIMQPTTFMNMFIKL